jgi:hypothetical protein
MRHAFSRLGYLRRFSSGTQLFIFVPDKFCVLLDKSRSRRPEIERFRMIAEKFPMDPCPNHASVRRIDTLITCLFITVIRVDRENGLRIAW